MEEMGNEVETSLYLASTSLVTVTVDVWEQAERGQQSRIHL